MAVNFFNIDVIKKINNRRILAKWIYDTLCKYKKNTGEINIILTSDKYLLALNQTHLNKDYLTDIITFNYNEGKLISGDLYISYDRIIENSLEYSTNPSLELSRVIIHGILHLLDFDDNSPEKRKIMEKHENQALKYLNIVKII